VSSSRSFPRQSVALSAGLLAGSLLLAACGAQSTATTTGSAGSSSGSGPASSSAAVTKDDALAAMVPDAVKSDGKLVIGTDSTYAPSEFLDTNGTTVIGFDVDLFDAVAAKLGLTTEWVSAPFDNIIPSVQSGKYEIGVSSFTINADRKKVVDMVSYFRAGTQWATKQGNPNGVSPDDACGKAVAVQKATVQVDDVTARSAACTKAGKPAITIDQFQGQDQATAAVVSGKDVAMLADSPVIAYAVAQTKGQLELLGDIYDSAPYGYVLKKSEGQYAQAVAGAVNALIADGTYKTILDKWGVAQGAITQAAVNP
jgi:polar amino acid transport system substrate-binding protein